MKPLKKLSIVIIAKNEEKNIGRLLDSIRKQKTTIPYEIILADAKSTDATVSIAGRYGVKIVNGGMPSVGRNIGASYATGDIILFLDADTVLPECFIEKNLAEFKQRNLSVAAVLTKVLSRKESHKLAYKVINEHFILTEKIDPCAFGYCIFCLTKIHVLIGGFNEKLKMFEDKNYAQRAAQTGRFGVLRAVPIMTYARRFEKDGITYSLFRAMAYLFVRRMVGDEKANKLFKYELSYEERLKHNRLEKFVLSKKHLFGKKPFLELIKHFK
jgi:glycosyltransferase involved in cell wall biosynthesis